MDKAEEFLNKISKPIAEDAKPASSGKGVEEGKKPEEGGKETPTPEPPKVDSISLEEFTKRLGVTNLDEAEAKLKEVDSIKTTFKNIEDEKNSLKQELDGYKVFADEAIDPMSYFADEKGFFAETLRKKYPNLEYSTAMKLVGAEVKDMSDLDAMILSEVVKHADIGLREDEAEAKVLKRLGVESREDVEEMSATDKKLLKADAKEAKANLVREQDNAKKQPERRTPADFLAQHQKTKAEKAEAVKKAYEPIISGIVGMVKETIKEGDEVLFNINPDDSYMKELEKYALDGAMKRGLDTSEESKAEILMNVKAKFYSDNIAKILKAHKNTLRTEWQKEVDEKYANHKEVGIQKESDSKPTQNSEVINKLIKEAPRTGWGK